MNRGYLDKLLILIAVFWAVLGIWLVVRGVQQMGVLNYLDSGNVSGCLLGLVLPGAFIGIWHHRAQVKLHQTTRVHNTRLHEETRRHHEEHVAQILKRL